MNLAFHSLFWGVLLILFGLSVIIKAIFKVDVPLFRIFFGLFLLYLGAKVLFGTFGFRRHHGDAFFSKSNFSGQTLKNEYNIVFGSGNIDLNDIDLSEKSIRTEISVVFGDASIYINPNIPAKFYVETVFADAVLPGKSSSAIGKFVYSTPAYDENTNFLKVNLKVVFGSAEVVNR